MEKYVVIKIDYDGEYMSDEETREMVEENMLQYADGAPFDISIDKIYDLPV